MSGEILSKDPVDKLLCNELFNELHQFNSFHELTKCAVWSATLKLVVINATAVRDIPVLGC